MKNLFLPLLFALLLLQACTNNIPTCEDCIFTCLDENEPDVLTNNCIDNWDCNFTVTAQSKVDLSEHNARSSGDNNVFLMVNSTEGSPQIIDDELTDILVFELDESQTSFSVEDSELESMNAHFRKICYCVENGFKVVNMGCLQGERQADGSWMVQGNLTVPYSWGNVEVKVDAQFVN